MSNIDNMLASIINKDNEQFMSSFSDEMKDRLSSSIIDKNLNISNSVMKDTVVDNDEVEEVEEAVASSKSYKFKSPREKKEFVVALSHMGVKKQNITQRGNVVLVKVRDKNTLQMIQTIAKDLKAVIKEDNTIISALIESYSTNSAVNFTLKDSSSIHILPEEAINVTRIHDSLSKDNQIKMRELLSENKDSFDKVLNFCNNKINTDDKE